MLTDVKIADPSAPVLCEVTATPARSAPDRLGNVIADPTIGVHVKPSTELSAEKEAPERTTRKCAGIAPGGLLSWSESPATMSRS
jgi:hypothetical protein